MEPLFRSSKKLDEKLGARTKESSWNVMVTFYKSHGELIQGRTEMSWGESNTFYGSEKGTNVLLKVSQRWGTFLNFISSNSIKVLATHLGTFVIILEQGPRIRRYVDLWSSWPPEKSIFFGACKWFFDFKKLSLWPHEMSKSDIKKWSSRSVQDRDYLCRLLSSGCLEMHNSKINIRPLPGGGPPGGVEKWRFRAFFLTSTLVNSPWVSERIALVPTVPYLVYFL
jgi:hypothetical protein